ncbi:uncharacterized protein EV422DRAFT_60252 [Fimicolochytrium jonesii]|uniref:uncharacterized protein n=1 Tax=Fimicolochytrium jonesii TaxID=1396493 RepID=UPI0022FE2376|nr:uncharacterized protein EV422DRAFT_60252 [Fimicolochytrium jonesii]KAI8820706.1 hypothetical protein EV422DRAFT_60252 [Fimicolochytrium jonesii]
MPGASNTETDEEYNPGKRRKLAIKNTKALSSAVKQPRLAIEDVAASVKRFTSSIKKRGPASSTKAKDRAVTLESLARQFLPSSDEEFESDEEQPQPTRTPSRAVSTRPVSSRRVPRYEEIGAYISPQVPQPHVPHPVEAGHVIMEIPTGDTTNVDIKGVSDIFGEIGQIYEAKLRSKAIYIDQKLARALSRMTKDITLVNEAVFAG